MQQTTVSFNNGEHKTQLVEPAEPDTQPMLSYTWFKSERDKYPKEQHVTWAHLSELLSVFEERGVRGGRCWSPTVYRPQATRSKNGVIHLTMAVLDIDDGYPIALAQKQLEGWAYLIYPSYSYTERHEKYRVVLPFSKPIPAEDWPAVWERLNLFLFEHVDSATKDCSHIYYVPTKPLGSQVHFSRLYEGRWLSVDDLPWPCKQAKTEATVPASRPQTGLARSEADSIFAILNEQALQRFPEVMHWLGLDKGAEERGKVFMPINPKREDTRPGSFKIDSQTGAWRDWALDEVWGSDLVSLVAYIRDFERQGDAFTALQEFLWQLDPQRRNSAQQSPAQAILPLPSSSPSANDQAGYENVQACPVEPRINSEYDVGTNYRVNDRGIHKLVVKDGGASEIKIASRIDVIAQTRNSQNEQWGLLLRFKDRDQRIHEWSMPKELLLTPGDLWRQQLLSMGADVFPKSKDDLMNYFIAANPTQRALSVDTTGWHGNVFVLPSKTYGISNERVLLQSADISRVNPFATSGTLSDWKEHVAAKCVGNSRLILAVCTALAGPFLKPLGQENGGIHLRGPSSSGKTKTLNVAASVWGSRGMVRTWRTTGNAIESLANQHNETVLILDELSQVAADEAGDIAYTLGNGQSKARANRHGNVRPITCWRLLFLSTGEIGLAEHVAQAGGRVRAGQDIRLLEIRSDAGVGMGAFENLHGAGSPQVFADSLQSLSESFYGTAADALLTRLTSANPELQPACQAIRHFQEQFVSDLVPSNAHGQVYRAAGRFGLIGGVGEYCISAGILPWPRGEARTGVEKCFNAWLELRGGDQALEEVRALAQVREFFQRHGESRFTPLIQAGSHSVTDRVTANRAGYRNGNEFWVFPEIYKQEVCAGFDPKFVTALLRDKEILALDSQGKAVVSRYALGTTKRFYVVTESMLLGHEQRTAA